MRDALSATRKGPPKTLVRPVEESVQGYFRGPVYPGLKYPTGSVGTLRRRVFPWPTDRVVERLFFVTNIELWRRQRQINQVDSR